MPRHGIWQPHIIKTEPWKMTRIFGWRILYGWMDLTILERPYALGGSGCIASALCMNFVPFPPVVVEEVQRRGQFLCKCGEVDLLGLRGLCTYMIMDNEFIWLFGRSSSVTARSLVLQESKLWLDCGWIEHEGVGVHRAVSPCEARWKWTE